MDGNRAATIPFGGTEPARAGDSSKVAFAHALRGWAAMSVVVSHLAMSFWLLPDAIGGLIALPMPTDAPAPLVTRALDGAFEHLPWPASDFAFGPFGVALFFLISGFVIPFSFRKQSRIGFLAGRVLRLWPTYVAGLSLTLLALSIGALYEGKSFPYPARVIITNYALGLRDLLWAPSIDGIVWTLEIEIKFYLFCACFAGLLRAGNSRLFYFAVPAATAIVLSVAGYYDEWIAKNPKAFATAWVATVDAQMMLYMLIGTAFHYLYRGWMRPTQATLLVLGMYALFAYLAFNSYARVTAPKAVVSYAAALALFSGCYVLRDRFRGGGVSGWLADISYPLYAVHGVGGYVLLNLMVRNGISTDVALVISLVAALLVAWGLHVGVEKPTHRLATKVARALSPKPPVVAQPTMPHSLAA